MHRLPLSVVRRHLLVKDLKVFLRDVSQWSQLLLLLALVLVYLYNFRVLDLEPHPVHERRDQERLRVRQPGDGGLRHGHVAVRFVFPAVSAEGAAFWIIRTAPVSMQRLPVVEVLDRVRAGVSPDRGADDRRQRVPRRRSVPQGGGRRGDRLHEPGPGRAGHGPRRTLPAVRRGQRDARWRDRTEAWRS